MSLSMSLSLSDSPFQPLSESFPFPSSESSVVSSWGKLDEDEIGYFWSASRGDKITETFASGLGQVCQVQLDVFVTRNVLSDDATVDWSLEISGHEVTRFEIQAGFHGQKSVSKVLALPIVGDVYTIGINVMNQVPLQKGSHAFAYAGSLFPHEITLFGCDDEQASPQSPSVPPPPPDIVVDPPFEYPLPPSDQAGLDNSGPDPQTNENIEKNTRSTNWIAIDGATSFGSVLAILALFVCSRRTSHVPLESTDFL